MTYETDIRIRFQIGDYSDALYFTEAEWAAKPDVDVMAQQRYEKWQASVKPVEPPTKEQQLAEIADAKAALVDQIAMLERAEADLG